VKFRFAKTKTIFITLSNLPRAVRLIWSAGRSWTIAQILLLMVRGAIPASLMYLTKVFVDAVVLAVNENGNFENIYRVIWIAVIFGSAILLSEILGSVIQMIYAAQGERLTDHIFGMIHEKSVMADLAYYEQPEFFDHLYRARNQAYTRPRELAVQLGSLLQDAVTLVSMSLLLIHYNVWLPVILLLIALPTFYVVLSSSARMHSWQREKTGEERRSFYFDRLLTNGEYAAELRLFDLGGYFRNKFGKLRFKLRGEKLRLAVRQRILEFAANVIALVLTAAVFGWILWRTLQGSGTVGDLALFYQVFNQGQSLLKSFLGEIGGLYSNSLFLGDLFEFLDLQPQVVSPETPATIPNVLQKGISIEHVSFRYHDGKKDALTNFSLFIPANAIVAVVGANGAGKSTLLKLICRFYDPQKGAIKFDGTDLRNFSIEELRRMITVLFQTPVRYSMTARENIALGNIETISDIEKIERAAREAGADGIIENFPKGYAQMLSRRFAEGDELSVGEWQRIALARAVFRQAPVIVLDEPTSAMDPWAEADWLKRFAKQAQGKTVLIITHRFTTAMRAELIYVMQNGEIVESGSHAELVAKGGRYAESWSSQTMTEQYEALGKP